MAFTSSKSIVRLIPNIIRQNHVNVSKNMSMLINIGQATTLKPLSRSIWSMSNIKWQKDRLPCGCCRSFSGQADKDIAEFLTSEIKSEKESVNELPDVDGFKVEKTKGSEVVMVKELAGETIRVKTNVNNAMDDDNEGMETDEAKMVCRPPILIEITKSGSNKTLCVSCEFPHSSEISEEDTYVDSLEIRELAFYKKGDKWEEDTYTLAAAVMDGNLYDLMLSMLEERGIDGAFCDKFVTYATEYEHNAYVDFLENFQDFVTKG